jgi:hypothetical protein
MISGTLFLPRASQFRRLPCCRETLAEGPSEFMALAITVSFVGVSHDGGAGGISSCLGAPMSATRTGCSAIAEVYPALESLFSARKSNQRPT